MRVDRATLLLPLAALLMAISGCEKIDNHRLPPANVNIVFMTSGDWVNYGVAGPGQSREFIKSKLLPAGYPYKESEFTGFGGVVLICDPNYNYYAYDLACPVECKADVRIEWETGTTQAGIMYCPKCGSRYDVYSFGAAISGPALEDRYGLQPYNVYGPNTTLPCAVVRR